MAVNLFQTGGGGNWNNTASWSLGTIPTSSDGHVATFDATSPNCTLGGNRTCNNIDFTGYTNTLTMGTSTLTVSGNMTFDTGMNISGTGTLVNNASATITSNGFAWPNQLNLSGTNTKTFVGDFTCNGLLNFPSGGNPTLNKTTSEKIYAIGGLTLTSTPAGNMDVYLQGGTLQGAGSFAFNLFLDGNVTVSGTIGLGNGSTITRISGTITTTGSLLNIIGNTTFDTDGIAWNDVATPTGGGGTITINSTLTVNGTLTIRVNPSFDGTHGFVAHTLSHIAITAATVTLKEGITYTITSAFNCFSSRVGAIVLFTSSHASNKAILTLQNPAACNVLASFRRIDASAGRSITPFNGTITDCLNVISWNDLPNSNHSI
jgi:hypothetical protein